MSSYISQFVVQRYSLLDPYQTDHKSLNLPEGWLTLLPHSNIVG